MRLTIRTTRHKPAGLRDMGRKLPSLGLVMLFGLAPTVLYATETQHNGFDRGGANALEEEIGGLIVDDTITHIGHTFARHFSEYRHSNHPGASYNLTIHERPSARWGSLIWVTHNRQTLFRSFVGPRKAALQDLAHAAATQIDKQVTRMNLQRLLADNFDLDRDEI